MPMLLAMATLAPDDSTLRAVVRGAGGNAVAVTRRGEDVEVLLADGRELALLFTTQPEVETWRRLLAPAGIGPRLFGAGRGWLLVERCRGIELEHCAPALPWDLAVAWLGRLHGHFHRRREDLGASNPYLPELGHSWFAAWSGRSLVVLATSPDPRARRLRRALERYHRTSRALAALPITLVNADLHAGNVLVDVTRRRVWPRSWACAAIGPGVLDLALLTEQLGDAERARLVRVYARAAKQRVMPADLDRCRLHLALQAIGRSGEHASHVHDRIGDALLLAETLEL